MRTKRLNRPCCICHNEIGNVLFTQSFIVPDNFPLASEANNLISKDIVSCNKCGFCFTDESLSQSDFNDYYEKYAKHSHFSVYNTNTPVDNFNAFLIDIIYKICNHDTGKKVVDIGCGSGKLLLDLKSKGFTQLTGIDISASTGACLERYGIHYQSQCITENTVLTKDSKSFDLVSMISVLEHVLDLQHCIYYASSILKDNGYILISVPNASLFHECLPNPVFQISLEHINHFDSISLCNLMAQHGFQKTLFENFVLECERFTSNQMIHVFQKTNIRTTSTNIPFAENAAKSISKLASIWQKKPVNEIITKLSSTHEEIAVYGAGIYTFNLLADTELKNCNIVCFIDGNPDKQGKTLLNIPIHGPEFLLNFSGSIVICIANELKSVKDSLRKKGIKNKTYIL